MNKFLAAFLFILIFSAGCRKTTEAPPAITLLRRINNDPDLVILNTALRRIHIDTAFANGGPYTFFAPVDSAFVAAGLTIQKINEYNIDSLRTLIGYHVIGGRVGTGDILGFLRKRFSSLSPYEPFISKNYYGIFINGIHVGEGNIDCSDGVLHKIEGVCFPPAGDLYETILRQPDLSYAAELLKGNPQTLAVLRYASDSSYIGPGGTDVNVTAILPNNAAFQAVGLTLDTLRQWIIDGQSARLVNNGVIANEFFTADFRPSALVNGNNTGVYSFFPVFGFGIRDDGLQIFFPALDYYGPGTNHGRLTRPNIAATNGVLHVVDSLLIFTRPSDLKY